MEHILRYARRERGTWDRLSETEVEVSLVKEAYLLKGHVDLIRGEGDTVEIVDFKSEKKPDLLSEREKVERYRRQLEVYAHIIEGRTGQKLVRCTSTTQARTIAIRISALTRMRARLIKPWRRLMELLNVSKTKTLKSLPVLRNSVGTAISKHIVTRSN